MGSRARNMRNMAKDSPHQIVIKCAGEMVEIGKLKPHPKNPREHSKKQVKAIAEAIKRNGFRRPIVASRLSGTIIAGHGTIEAAKSLGMATVPVDWQEFADAAAEAAFLVSDNHLARMGTTDSKMIAEIMADHGEIDLESFGFTEAERMVFSKDASGEEAGESSTKKRKTTKNGVEVAEDNGDEQPALIVANVSKAAARRFSDWKKKHEITDDDKALDAILNNLKA